MGQSDHPVANGPGQPGAAPSLAAGDRRSSSGEAEAPALAKAESLAALLGERELNLRQVILRAHRGMNRWIAEKFGERGFAEIRPAHLTLLSNMNLGETSVSDLADRAQMNVEGMQQLAADLDRLGFIQGVGSPSGPGQTIGFTDAGWELMLTSFNIQREIEADCKARLQDGDLEQLRRILGLMFRPG